MMRRGRLRRSLLRALRIPPVVLGVVTLLFVLLQAAPGDPADLLLSPRMTEEVRAQVRTNLGLDDPPLVQYGRWLGATARGDLGRSISAGRPVTEIIAAVLPDTLLLVGSSLLLAFGLGTAIGAWQGWRGGGRVDGALNGVTLFFHSMPSFWLAVMLVLVFAGHATEAGWWIRFPASGTRSLDYEFLSGGGRLFDRIRHMVLPVATLTLVMLGGISRQLRTAVLEERTRPYVLAARSRGVPEGRILRRHVIPNAALPLITLLGVYLPALIGGAIFVETVFAWPGMGRALVTAVGQRDYPLVMGIALVLSLAVVLANLVADLLYLRADPRIRDA